MTISDINNPTDTDVDPSLSRQYRLLATESTPDELDRAVLRTARDHARKKSSASWLYDRFKPAAFAVMLVLSFAVILEMNDAGILPTAFSPDDEAIPANGPTHVFQDAAESVAEQIRQAEEAAGSAIQNSGSVDAATGVEVRTAADQVTLLPDDPVCDASQRSTVTTWWQCIAALEASGATAAAERELVELTRAFPGFIQPD